MKSLIAAIALLALPVVAHAEQFDLPLQSEPQIAQTEWKFCKWIGINGKYRWWCPNGANVRDHRGCKTIKINGNPQRICKKD